MTVKSPQQRQIFQPLRSSPLKPSRRLWFGLVGILLFATIAAVGCASSAGGGADGTTSPLTAALPTDSGSNSATAATDELAALTETPGMAETTNTTEATAATGATGATEAIETTETIEAVSAVETNPTDGAAPSLDSSAGPLAAEFTGIDAWINSDPLTIEQLRGKVVLVDFWTYTCINCIRTFPFLKLWNSRYADDGLVILGVHTPEFDFEKDYENVLQATRDNGIIWPVAQDNKYGTWEAYNNRAWPAKYLIDRNGVVRYSHFGEGKYAETEEQIRTLLAEAGADLSDDLVLPEDQELDPAFLNALDAEVTPELYAGYERNFSTIMTGIRPYVIQEAFYQNPDAVVNFVSPESLKPHLIYFDGPWLVGAERAKHARTTNENSDHEDFIALNYSAKSVNAVLTSDSGQEYRVRVTLDGEYLTEANKGLDIRIAEDGESYLPVDEPRLYEIIDNPFYTQRKELRLSSNSADFGLFAFTFGVYQEGP